MEERTFLIVGAGPTGLGAAYRLKELGEDDFYIVERNQWVGGLAASFKDPRGFTWDIGGHVQFSHYPYFDDAMKVALAEDEWLHHERESWVWMCGRFVPYPFQNNIGFLPDQEMWDCLKGLYHAAHKATGERPKNFDEWIVASFGAGVADHFMRPYNYKVWAYPPRELNYHWIGERVATVNFERILENVIHRKMDASWGPNNTFRFPREGGTGSIWNSIARHVGMRHIELGTSIINIDAQKRVATRNDGRQIKYDYLLSTMPLDLLTKIVHPLSKSVKQHAAQLKHSSSNIVGVGVKGTPHPLLAKKCWMYFPESNCPFYRMTVFSNYSPENVPGGEEGYYSLMCEISESPSKLVNRSALAEETIKGLRANDFLPEDNEIVSTWVFSAEYGYPTPSLERDSILADTVPVLDQYGIFSRGRFGGWKYEVSNQDHSFMQGVEWVNRLVAGEVETTYRADTTQDPNLTVLAKQHEKGDARRKVRRISTASSKFEARI